MQRYVKYMLRVLRLQKPICTTAVARELLGPIVPLPHRIPVDTNGIVLTSPDSIQLQCSTHCFFILPLWESSCGHAMFANSGCSGASTNLEGTIPWTPHEKHWGGWPLGSCNRWKQQTQHDQTQGDNLPGWRCRSFLGLSRVWQYVKCYNMKRSSKKRFQS